MSRTRWLAHAILLGLSLCLATAAWKMGRAGQKSSRPIPLRSAVVPVLMYHHVRPIDFRQSDAFTSDLTLPPAEFERQLRYLRDRGFHTATMAEPGTEPIWMGGRWQYFPLGEPALR